MTVFHSVRSCFFGLALLALAACQTTPPTPEPQPVKAVSDETILQALERHHDSVYSVRSFVTTRIRTRLVDHVLRQTVVARNDQSIRLDTLSNFGQPLGVFIFKPGNIQIYDPQKNVVHTGAEAWYMMADLFGTSFDFAEFISVFLGKVPRYDRLKLERITAHAENLYVMDAEDPVRKERTEIEIDADTLHPVGMTRFRSGEALYSVAWTEAKWIGAVYFPHRVTVQRHKENDEVILSYRNPQVNPVISDDVFELFPGRAAP
ncbi:DUF4292 domain-containing protein [Nitrospina sp. 32_T5]|uniref:DUF4292 domain-containing protein n=1 Tax=unclassified Nitrospina TaxID=2638683 RepID=UPI003F94860A